MLQRHVFHIVRFLVLPNPAPPQHIPAVVRRHLVEPGRERPRRVVLPQFALQFHEYFHGGVFSIFPSRQGTPTEAEYRRCVFPVKLAPSLGVTRPGTGDYLRRFRYSQRVHAPSSQRSRTLIPAVPCQYYTFLTPPPTT